MSDINDTFKQTVARHNLNANTYSTNNNTYAIRENASAVRESAEATKALTEYLKLFERKVGVQEKSLSLDKAQLEVLRRQVETEKDTEKKREKYKRYRDSQISMTKEYIRLVGEESESYGDLINTLEDLEKKREELDEKSKKRKIKLSYETRETIKDTEEFFSKQSALTNNYFETALQAFEEYYTKVNTRLGNSGNTFDSLISNSFGAIGQTPIVDNKVLVANISELVNKGVASDVELIAFLQTVSDSVATTFDAFDSNILRLIRLQGQNNEAAYMGMEVALNDLFTETFSDSSYLSDLRKSVSDAILDANAMLVADEGTEFSYVVQKWLGALYESGASQGFINSLASGINLLGTGNVQALSSNSQLQSLLAMSASRAGLNYADLLTGGLNASNTNALLASLLQYLNEVATSSSGNNVLRSAYGDIFNFGTSDLRAIENLFSSGAYASLGSQGLTASDAVMRLQQQLNTAYSRMSTTALFDNFMDNLAYQSGMNVATNEAAYVLYKIGDVIGKTFGDFDVGIGGKDIQALLQGSLQLINTPGLNWIGDTLGIFSNGQISDVTKIVKNFMTLFGSKDALSSTFSNGLLSTMFSNMTTVDLNAFKGFSRSNTLLSGNQATITGIEPTDEEDNPITWLRNIDKNTTNTDVKPILTSDRTMKNSIEELESKIESMKFHINIDSVNSDVILKTTVDYSNDAQKIIQDAALNLAKRMVSVIYNGSASTDDEKIDDEQSLRTLISSMLAVNERGSGETMNVNLASTDLTVKDMLVRRV